MGNREDGADSLASQVKPASHWPGMRVLIAVVSGEIQKIFEGESTFGCNCISWHLFWCRPATAERALQAALG